jgi:hypothetical protein
MLYYDKLTREVVDDPNKVNIDQRSMETLVEKYKDKLDNKEGVLMYDEDINSLVYKEYIVLLGVNKNAAEQWTRLNEREESQYFTTVEIPLSLFKKYDDMRKKENTVVTYTLDKGFEVFDVPQGYIYDNKEHVVVKFELPFRKVILDTETMVNNIFYDGILFDYNNVTYKLPFRLEDQQYFTNLLLASPESIDIKFYKNSGLRNSSEFTIINIANLTDSEATIKSIVNTMTVWNSKLKNEVNKYIVEYDGISLEDKERLTKLSNVEYYVNEIQKRINSL